MRNMMRRAVNRRFWIPVAAASCLIIFLLVLDVIDWPVYSKIVSIDGVTGSLRTEIVWWNFWSTGSSKTGSALERFLVQNGIPWTPRWSILSIETTNSLFLHGRGGSPAPPVYELVGIMDEVTTSLTPDEIRSLVRSLESDPPRSRRQRFDAMSGL